MKRPSPSRTRTTCTLVDEVTELASAFDGRMHPEARFKIFRAFDADGDGQVSLDDKRAAQRACTVRSTSRTRCTATT